MKIEVDAKLLINVPDAKKEDNISNIVLASEQFINKLQGFNTSDTHTAVDVRIHVDMKSCQERA